MQIGIQPTVETTYERSGERLKVKGEFSYTLRWPALAPSLVESHAQIALQNDADFLWLASSWFADTAGSAVNVYSLDAVSASVAFSVVNEPFQNTAIPLVNFASAPTRERYMRKVPFWLPRGGVLNASVMNFSLTAFHQPPAPTYDLWITLHGIKYTVE